MLAADSILLFISAVGFLSNHNSVNGIIECHLFQNIVSLHQISLVSMKMPLSKLFRDKISLLNISNKIKPWLNSRAKSSFYPCL